MLTKMKIRHRLWLLIALTWLALSGAAAYSLSLQKDALMQARRAKTVTTIEIAYSVLEHFGKLASSGVLTLPQAQEAAKATVGGLRYDQDNYFSTYDLDNRMVKHPIKPEMDGKDMSGLKDPNGVRIVVELVEAAKRGKGEFVDYLWPRPGAQQAELKIATSRLYQPWGWVLQSGMYVGDVETEFRRQLLLYGSGILGVTIILLLLSWRIAGSISGPLQRLQETVSGIADSGDLRGRADTGGGGEIAAIAVSLNAMLENFQGIIRAVSRGTSDMSVAVTQLAGNAHNIHQSSTHQSSSATSAAAAIEEVSTSIQQISGNVSHIAELAEDARKRSRDGRDVVHSAAGEMENIANSVKISADAVSHLGEESRRISAIVEVIKDIAEQTNLLALNAAIEAARAGEAGRGFAVVADEVRKLSERTGQSTRQISELIVAIQGETAEAVHRIRDVSEQALKGVSLATAAGESVARIDDGSAEVAKIISEVADATQAQSRSSHEIARHIEEISEMAGSNARAIREMATAAQTMESMARGLDKEISRFRV